MFGYFDKPTVEELNKSGYFKVDESSGTLITVKYFNADTEDEIALIARDYDYFDCSRDNDSIYFDKINQEVWVKWMHHNGQFVDGDRVVISKGRTLPVGLSTSSSL